MRAGYDAESAEITSEGRKKRERGLDRKEQNVGSVQSMHLIHFFPNSGKIPNECWLVRHRLHGGPRRNSSLMTAGAVLQSHSYALSS